MFTKNVIVLRFYSMSPHLPNWPVWQNKICLHFEGKISAWFQTQLSFKHSYITLFI